MKNYDDILAEIWKTIDEIKVDIGLISDTIIQLNNRIKLTEEQIALLESYKKRTGDQFDFE